MSISPPCFKVPLSRSILNDPAFSPDPRSHPNFPLANASSYKFVPPSLSHPFSQHSIIPVSDSLSSFSSPTVSSAISLSQSSIQSPPSCVPYPVALFPPSNPLQPLPIQPKVVTKPPHPNQPTPLPIRKSDSTRENLKPVPLHNRNTSRKGKMKALVRRITSRQNLDRIDELDETDPFGGGYHHGGPYEAIGSNLAQPTLLNTYSNLTPRRGIKFDPPPSRPGQHQSRGSSAHDEMGLSSHIQPGQTLRQNHTSSIPSMSSQPRRRPDAVAIVTQPDISQSRSPTNPWTHTPERPSTSSNLLDEHQNQSSSSSHAPRVENTGPDVPDSLPLYHSPVAAPYVHHQTETTVFPPPRHESKLHNLGPPRSHSPPSFKPTSRRTQSTESAIPATRPHDSRHKSVHSLGTSHSIKIAMTQSPSIVQNRPPEPPRIRHLPKRLVMPAPLQPQPPPPQHSFPSTGPAGWDAHLDDRDLECAPFEGQLAMYNEEPRLLRKRSSSFPAKVPIPDHVPISQADAVSAMGNPSTKVAKEVETTKEGTRRRKLSKRKHDI